MTEAPVVIVGAGPVGISTAILLAQNGVRSVVVERHLDTYPLPRAVALDDEVLRILHSVGVADDFLLRCRTGAGLRLLSSAHETLVQFDRTDDGAFPQSVLFDQPDLERLLRARAMALPEIDLRAGLVVTGLTQDTGSVRVRATDADGQDSDVVGRLVVGCDGANSVVRAAIGSTMRSMRFEQRWLVADLVCTTELDAWGGVHQVCDEQRASTFMRIGDERYRFECQLLDDETPADYATATQLLPLLAPWLGDTTVDDLGIIRSVEYTFRAAVADRWRVGRVLLAGDAVHLTPPFIGQGLGSGLRDAAAVAWRVAAVLDGASDDLLDDYQRERAPHARELVRRAVLIGAAMTGGGAVASGMRHLLVPRLSRVPGFSAQVLDSETPPLRVLGRRSPTSIVGRLGPSLRLADGRHLDDRLGRGWSVLAGRRTDEVDHWVDAHRATLVHAGDDAATARWMGERRLAAVLMRPDRTIARVSRS